MAVYFTTLALIAILSSLYGKRNTKTINNILVISCAIILIFVSGFRYCVGTDYLTYAGLYPKLLTDKLSFFSQPALGIVARISAFIFNDYAMWFFLMAVITVAPVIYIIKKDSISFSISIILYMLLGCWHYSFNGVKQCAAASILLLGYNYIKERKFFKWCLICLIASFFHISALLMIPLYFLIVPKISTKRIMLLILIGAIIFFFYDELFDMFEILRPGASDVDSDVGQRDVSILRIAVCCAPAILGVIFKSRFDELDQKDERFAVLFNLSVMNAVLNVGTMFSVYLNRFTIYTNIFNILFIPYLAKLFKKNERIIFLMVMMSLYFIFWYYDISKPDTADFQWIFERL